MFPFIIKQGEFVIPTFFFMILVASLATTFYLYWLAPKKGKSQIVVLDIAIFGTIFGVIGARLFHVFVEAFWFYKENPFRILEFWRGGFVGYGAFFGVLISTLAYLKIRKLPILDYADFIALGCPLIIFFVRIGCIGAGCCYGTPTEFALHLTFINPSSDAGSKFPGVHLHATQIYDMVNAAAIFAFINWKHARRKFCGEIILWFFGLYGLLRGLIEFLRGDLDRGVYFDGLISTSQVTGLVNIAVCVILYFVLWHRAKNRAPAKVLKTDYAQQPTTGI